MAPGARLQALIPHDLDRLPAELAGGVVAVGNFDGMHRGHVALLESARAAAGRRGVPSLALTFEPHPRTVFRPATPVFRLTPLAVKARILRTLRIDGLAVAKFDRTFAAIAAEAFIETVLVGRLRIAEAVVGFNFRFGRQRAGTLEMLVAAGRRDGFAVSVVEPVPGGNGEPLSSSAVRDALAAGNVAGANSILGYRWFVVAEVGRGAGRGRDLGYPTANLTLGADCALRHGVYAARVQRAGGRILDAVASFGRRPTFDNGAPLLEVFVFDFSDDLYGEEIAVTLLDWIRAEEAFGTPAALVAAMERDTAAARAILAATGPGSGLDAALAALP